MGSSKFIDAVIMILMMVSSFGIFLMADPRTSIVAFVCSSSRIPYDAAFVRNAATAMTNLSNLVEQNGFGITVVGEGPETMYALAQCYKDLSPIDCRLCFSEIRSIFPTCTEVRGGRIFLDGCFMRYENFSFFNQGIDSVVFKNCSSKKISQPDKFGVMIRKVIENISLRAPKRKGFAVASEIDSNLSVYALAQCWNSLDERTCNSCLHAAASLILSCSPAVGGRSLYAGCYMRYSMSVFWNSNQSTESSSEKSKSLWIILCSVLGGCLLLAGIALWKVRAHFSRSYDKSSKDSYGSELSAAILHSKLSLRYQELRMATQNFDLSNKLGQGSYETVYKGILSDGREVAVKRLFFNTARYIDQFFNEVNLINQVHHKNLVKLLGCSVDGPESLLVYEYYRNKSLDYFIFDKNQAEALDWQKRFDIIQGVAEGLSYLHEKSEIRIVHRDIKASNVLLDNNLKPKITDFGLARSFPGDQTHFSTGIAGTLGYMAPEYIVHGHLTEKADVFSFGVLILEIVTGQRCCNGIGMKPGHYFLAKIWSNYEAKTIKSIIDRGIYKDSANDEILRVFHVALLCVQATPSYRPTMTKVVELLRNYWDQGDVVYPTAPPFLDILANEEEG